MKFGELQNIIKEKLTKIVDYKNESPISVIEKLTNILNNINETKKRINIYKREDTDSIIFIQILIDNVILMDISVNKLNEFISVNDSITVEQCYAKQKNPIHHDNYDLNTVIYDIRNYQREEHIIRYSNKIKDYEDKIKGIQKEINYFKDQIRGLNDEREEDLSKYIYSNEFVNYESNADPDFDPLYDENNLPFPLDEPEVER